MKHKTVSRIRVKLPYFGEHPELNPNQEAQLGARINQHNEQHFRAHQPHPKRFPHPELYHALQEDHQALREISDLEAISAIQKILDAHGKKPGTHQPSVGPQDVHTVVMGSLARGGVTPVTGKGNIRKGELNCENADDTKYAFYQQTYHDMFICLDLVFLSEVTRSFMRAASLDLTGYGSECASENERGQAVGILYNKEVYELIMAFDLKSMADPAKLMGIKNMRSAKALWLRNKRTGQEELDIVVHLKSMRGGPASTAPVRFKQCKLLIEDLKALFLLHPGLAKVPLYIAGDFNTFVNNTKDLQPLIDFGCILIYPNNSTSTQQMGGRLDGLYYMNNTVKIGHLQIFPFFKNKLIGRSFTDHALNTWIEYICAQMPNDPNCKGNTGDKVDDSADPEVPVQ